MKPFDDTEWYQKIVVTGGNSDEINERSFYKENFNYEENDSVKFVNPVKQH